MSLETLLFILWLPAALLVIIWRLSLDYVPKVKRRSLKK